MTLSIAHAEEGGVTVLDLVREVRPRFSPEAVVGDFSAILKAWGCYSCRGDAYAGSWPTEAFAKVGITYSPSAEPKSRIYERFLATLNSNKVRLLDHDRLKAQLLGLERRTARAGKDSIDHGPGGHDDVINAAAGAMVLAAAKTTNIVGVLMGGDPRPSPWISGGRGVSVDEDGHPVIAGVARVGPIGINDVAETGSRWRGWRH
jgi:hypothetical protein